MTGVLAALARRTPHGYLTPAGALGLREAVPRTRVAGPARRPDEVSAARSWHRLKSRSRTAERAPRAPDLGKCGGVPGELKGRGRRWKKAPLLLGLDRRSQGCGAGAKERPEGTPGPPPRKPHGADSVPRPKGARSRKSRPHADVTLAADAGRGLKAVRGRDGRPEAELRPTTAGTPGPGSTREASAGVAKIPHRRKERTVRGRHLLQGAREARS